MSEGRPTQAERGARFRDLHEGEPFVMPNPWDAGSAKVLAAQGFEALATTSSGFAFTLGRTDGEVNLAELEAHVRLLADATDLPLSVDLENGFGELPGDASRAIVMAAGAGAVGGSIEDYDPDGRIYCLEHAVARVSAAVEAAKDLDFPFTLTARAENHIRGNPDLDDTIARLQAYEEAGADVLFAPGLRSREEIAAARESVSRPLNVLIGPGLSAAEAIDAGAQRISVGGGLAWAAVNALVATAKGVRDGESPAWMKQPTDLGEWLGA